MTSIGPQFVPRIHKVEPRIEASIWPTGDGQWALGNLMRCERIADGASAPGDAITTWKDGKGVDYCLRPQTTRLPVTEYDPANGPHIAWNYRTAIFEIGHDVFIKVTHKTSPFEELEGESMRLVRERAPSVPVPEAIHYWLDKEWNRYFLITRRVHGVLLDRAWFQLQPVDKIQVAKELAAHTKSIAQITAPRFMRVNGSPQHDPCLVGCANFRRDAVPGPYTAEELREHMRRVSDGVEPPEFGPDFHFYHGDMGPGNVILSGTDEPHTEGKSHVHIAGIIDWEQASFYPKFWITLYPISLYGAYVLSLTEEQMKEDMDQCAQYMCQLDYEMQDLGFQSGYDFQPWYTEFYRVTQREVQKLMQEAWRKANQKTEL